jgi:hypothetical protein
MQRELLKGPLQKVRPKDSEEKEAPSTNVVFEEPESTQKTPTGG